MRREPRKDPERGASPGGDVRARKTLAVLYVVAGILMAAGLWGDRGPVLAAIALLTAAFVAAGVLVGGFREWLKARPYLDAFVLFPAILVLLAFATDVSMPTLLTIAAFAWLIATVAVTRRRQREVDERGGPERGRRHS